MPLVGAPRNRYVKFFSLGLTDLFFSSSRYPWAFVDLILVFLLFITGMGISPYAAKYAAVAGPASRVCAAVFALTYVGVTLGLGAYDRTTRFDLSSVLRSLVIANLIAGIAAPLVLYFVYFDVIGRLSIVYGGACSALGTLCWRLMGTFILRKNPYRFSIVGKSPIMDEVVAECEKRTGRARHYLYTPWNVMFTAQEPASVHKLLVAKVGDVVLTKDALAEPAIVDLSIQCLQAKLRLVDETEFATHFFERLPVDHISKDWILRQGLARRQILTLTIKRAMDICLSALALLLLSPVLVGIALGIKVTSSGPIFFNQRRQGRYSEPFTMHKFRTMSVDANGDSTSGASAFTKKRDERVTSFGRILRPLHFDELPQLLNILQGDMSLIGPRPEALEFAKKMREKISFYELRYLVRPGLSGHAQVNQGYAMDTVDETKRKLSYDLYYLCHYSIWMDLQIILKTFFFLTHRAR